MGRPLCLNFPYADGFGGVLEQMAKIFCHYNLHAVLKGGKIVENMPGKECVDTWQYIDNFATIVPKRINTVAYLIYVTK